jgi:hypothetical protein
MIRCFAEAHSKELDGMRSFRKFESDEHFEDFKMQYVRVFIKGMFCAAGFCSGNGTYENPTKNSLLKVIEKLKEYSADFRGQDIIDRHAAEVMLLVKKL